MNADKPALSLDELRAYDPNGGRGSGREVRFLCPLCGDDKPKDRTHACLDVNTETGAWNCKRCKAKGLLKEHWTHQTGGGQDWKRRKAEAVRRAFAVSSPKPPPPDAEKYASYRQLVGRTLPLAGSPAEAYLQDRGIPAYLAAACCRYSRAWQGIGPAAVFPVRDDTGKPIAANARRITPGPGPKAKTAGELKRGVFYTPGALDSDPVAITEAPIDALTLALVGLPAIALCGTDNRPPWLARRLATTAPNTPPGYSRTVYLAFDNDRAGHKAAAVFGAALFLVRQKRLCPTRKDWNEDLTTDGIDALMDTLAAAGVYDSPEAYAALDTEAPEDPPAARDSCEDTPTDSRPTEDTASESNPSASFCESEAREPESRTRIATSEAVDPPAAASLGIGKSATSATPAELAAQADALAAIIRAALAGRALPIPISSGETISDPEAYAVSEAKNAVSPSPAISRPALDRLAALGIALPSWP